MAQVSILRRSRTYSSLATGQATEAVEVTYSTPGIPPRHVHLAPDLYRLATPDELAANPCYQMLPVSEQAAAAEREAIQSDMKAYYASVPQTYELP